jgi:hypothetical protein
MLMDYLYRRGMQNFNLLCMIREWIQMFIFKTSKSNPVECES